MRVLFRATLAAWLACALLGAVWPPPAFGTAGTADWPTSRYTGATRSSTGGVVRRPVPSYSISYPPGWTARSWPDTLATYGQLSLWSPAGGIVDVVVIPLNPHGPTLGDLIAQDATFLSHATREDVVLPLGRATMLSGAPKAAGFAEEVLYMQHKGLAYRFNAIVPSGSGQTSLPLQIASSMHVPAAPPKGPMSATPTPSPHPAAEGCCHCPAWGAGWGRVLTKLDGVPVYSNAGDINNGCGSTYGISYQCVELVQRYFSIRWGYATIWQGVGAAVDMRLHHPRGIVFTPNGGSVGPRTGDAIVFYGGSFGHVALVAGVDRRARRLDIVEENWSETGTASLTMYADGTLGIRDSTLGSYVVAGWLHSMQNAGSALPHP